MNCSEQSRIKNILGVVILRKDIAMDIITLDVTSTLSPRVKSSAVSELLSSGYALYFDLTNTKATTQAATTHKDIISDEIITSVEAVTGFTAGIGASDGVIIKSLGIKGSTRAYFISSTGVWGRYEWDIDSAGYRLRPLEVSIALDSPFPNGVTAASGSLPFVQASFTLGTQEDIASWTHIPCDDPSMDCFISLEPGIPVLAARQGNTIGLMVVDLNYVPINLNWPSAPTLSTYNLTRRGGTSLFDITDPDNHEIGFKWTEPWNGVICVKPLKLTI